MFRRNLWSQIACIWFCIVAIPTVSQGQGRVDGGASPAAANSDHLVGETYVAFQVQIEKFIESSLGQLFYNPDRGDEATKQLFKAKSVRGAIALPDDINRFVEPSSAPPFDWYLEFELDDPEAQQALEKWLTTNAIKETDNNPPKYNVTVQLPDGELTYYYVIDGDTVTFASSGFPFRKSEFPELTASCEKLLKASNKNAIATMVIDMKAGHKLMDSAKKLAETMNQGDVLSWLATLRGAEGLTASLVLGDPNRLSLEFDCNSDKSANAIESLITELVAKGLESQRAVSRPEPMVMKILDSVKSKVNGRLVEVTASIDEKIMNRMQENSERIMLMNNLKQIGLSMHNFESANGSLPFQPQPGQDESLSWRLRVLPYIDQAELFEQVDWTQPWDSAKNRGLIAKAPEIFGKDGQTNLRWIKSDIKTFADITNGTSNTICFIYSPDSVPWTQNNDMTTFEALAMFAALKPGETLMASMYDGSVRVISRDLDVTEFEKMLIPRNDD